MEGRKHLFYPVETINRELDFRLALAILTARPDNRVYIGLHETLLRLARHLRGGVYLGKNAGPSAVSGQPSDYEILKEQGFDFIHLDTEGAVYPGDPDRWRAILRRRLDPTVLNSDDTICTWGDFQRDVYRELAGPTGPRVQTTGHPRFDLYRHRWRSFYEADARQLRARFGEFVLINTNFTHANNLMSTAFVFSRAGGFCPDDPHRRLETVRDWAYMNEQLGHFVRLVHRLHRDRPELPVVVRPHPTEDPSFYRRAFQGLAGVHILHEGPVGPWLLASRCMIHDGCTTGVEARLSDTPIINFRPVDDNSREFYLPNSFGIRCRDDDQVLAALDEVTNTPEGRPMPRCERPPRQARRLLHNLSAESFPSLLEVIDDAQRRIRHTREPSLTTLRGVELLGESVESVKHLLRPLSPRHRHAARYGRAKFPGLCPRVIRRRLYRLQKVAGRQVDHRVISRGLMIVEAR